MKMLLKNVRIVDGTGGEPIEDGAIAVEGQRLRYVGPLPGAPSAVDGQVVVDGQGRTVIPGLLNCHTHVAHDEMDTVRPRRLFPEGEIMCILQTAWRARRCLENGITGLRDCNAGSHGMMALRRAFDTGMLPGPRLFLSGRAICATGGHMHLVSREVDGPDEARNGVREQIKIGADFIKIVVEASSGGGTPRPVLQLTVPEMSAAVEAAHRWGKQVTVHAVSRHGIADALEAGVDCIEHGYDLTDDQIQMMKDRGVWFVPTLSVHDALLRHGRKNGWSPARMANSERVLARGRETVGRAFEAGLKMACGTDGGSPYNPVWDLVSEFRLLREAGLPARHILQMATRAAAELVGRAADLGTLEAGKLADMVLVDGDPLADFTPLGHPAAVIKDGEFVFNHPKVGPIDDSSKSGGPTGSEG